MIFSTRSSGFETHIWGSFPKIILCRTQVIGIDLGDRVIKVLPSYNSGTLVQVGTDATVFLRGQLLNANGEPISLGSGQIIAVGDRNSFGYSRGCKTKS